MESGRRLELGQAGDDFPLWELTLISQLTLISDFLFHGALLSC